MKLLIPLTRSLRRRAFSLVEMLVAVAVFGLVMLLVFQMLDKTQQTWKGARDSVSEYKSARVAFEAITRRLSQATLNTYWQIRKGGNSGQLGALPFERLSDLHYVSGPASEILGAGPVPIGGGPRVGHCVFFQAPTGQSQSQISKKYRYANFQNTLNSWGYFVEFNNDEADRPAYLNGLTNPPAPRPRFRLMEYSVPAEANQVYKVAHDINLQIVKNSSAKLPKDATYEWFTSKDASGINFPGNYPGASAGNTLESRNVRVVAENILSVFILPTKSVDPDKLDDLAPNYYYDSKAWLSGSVPGEELMRTTRNQLAPSIQVTMIALDESDFKRMTNQLKITSGQDLAKVPFYADMAKLFKVANRFDEDLVELNRMLTRPQGAVKLPVQYRVFRATVRIRESRWGGFDPSLAQ